MNTVFWAQHAPPAPTLPPLQDEIACDVLVTGGGILGCSAALRLRELGVDVCLLEAQTPGCGASGRNGGLVVPSLPRLGPDDARRLLGADYGERLVRMVAGSARFVFDLIARYALQCDAVQQGWLNPCHAQSLIAPMQARAQAWANAGGQAVWLDADTTRQRSGSHRYLGAIFDPGGGHLNPLAYTRELARQAARLGARMYDTSPATSIRRQQDRWIVHTPGGVVRARRLLQCSHIQHPEINRHITPNLLQDCIPLTVYQLATTVIPANIRHSVLPENTSLSDSRNNLFACRHTADGRLVVGGMAAITHWRAEARLKRTVARRVREVFPQLEHISFEYIWHARAALTPDFLPRIVELGENWLAPLGCNGRGIAMSTSLGWRIAEYLASGNRQHLPIAPGRQVPIPLHAMARFLPQMLLPFGELQDRWRR